MTVDFLVIDLEIIYARKSSQAGTVEYSAALGFKLQR